MMYEIVGVIIIMCLAGVILLMAIATLINKINWFIFKDEEGDNGKKD